MRNVLTICKRELLAFFVSPIAYFVITGFLLIAGFFFFNLLAYFNIMLARFSSMPYMSPTNSPNLNQWVVEALYHTMIVVLVFLIPLLTMRMVAEEKKKGTFELLLTSPISVAEIVIGKFLGVAVILLVMMILIFAFPILLWIFGNPEVPPMFSGILGVFLCALGFASVGMAVSSFTENQIVAGVSGIVALLLLYVIHSPAESVGGVTGDVLMYLSPVIQVQDLVKGVITIKSIVYFVSLISFGLFLSVRALEAQRWR